MAALTVQIGSEVSGFLRGMQEAQGRLNVFAGALQRLGGQLAAALSVGGLVRFTKQAIDTADAMGKAAERVGMSVEQFSALNFAAGQSEVSMQELQLAMRQFSEYLVKSGRGSQDLTSALLAEADALRQVTDPAERMAQFADRFGRQSLALIPFLNQGSAAIRAQMEEAVRLGAVISGPTAAAADWFNDTLAELGAQARAVFMELAQRLLPTLIELATRLKEWAMETGQATAITGAFVTGLRALYNAGRLLWALFQTLGIVIGQYFGVAVESVTDAVRTATQVFGAWGLTLRAVWDLLWNLLRTMQTGSDVLVRLFSGDMVGAALAAKMTMLSAENTASQFAEAIVSNTATAAQAIKDFGERRVRATVGVVKDAAAEIKRVWAEAMAGLVDPFTLPEVQAVKLPPVEQVPTEAIGLRDYGPDLKEMQRGRREQAMEIQRDWRTNRMQKFAALQGIGMAEGPDPNSLPEQMLNAWRRLEDQLGTIAENIANTFTSVIGAAINSISNGIMGLIDGTMTWAGALRMIARSILQEVIQGIVKMFVSWIVNRLALRAVNVASSTAEAAAEAPKALMTSISSYGVAALVGAAAFAIAMAAAGGFARGGYTGDGSPGDIAGWAHRGEWVMPAETVRAWGKENMAAIQRGQAPASDAGSPTRLNVAVLADRGLLDDWARSTGGRAVLVDVLRGEAHRL